MLGARNEQDYPYFPHERHCVVAASFRDGREAHVDWGTLEEFAQIDRIAYTRPFDECLALAERLLAPAEPATTPSRSRRKK